MTWVNDILDNATRAVDEWPEWMRRLTHRNCNRQETTMKEQRIEELRALVKEWREIGQRLIDEDMAGLECADTVDVERLTAVLAHALPAALDEIERLRGLIEHVQGVLVLVNP